MKYYILLILIFASLLFAKDHSVLITGVSISQDMKQAIIEAQNDAKRKAIEQVAGVQLKSSSLVKNYQTVSDIILAESVGEVRKYDIIKWEVNNLSDDSTKTPVIQLSVEMQIEVSIPDVKSDANYQLSANLGKNVFFVGEEITIKNLQVTKNSYLYLFSINDSKVYPIIPNSLVNELLLKPNVVINFPSVNLKERGLRLKAQKMTTDEIEYEQLVIVAMKNKNSIFDKFVSNNKILGVIDFSNALINIPLNERILKIFDYEIRENN